MPVCGKPLNHQLTRPASDVDDEANEANWESGGWYLHPPPFPDLWEMDAVWCSRLHWITIRISLLAPFP